MKRSRLIPSSKLLLASLYLRNHLICEWYCLQGNTSGQTTSCLWRVNKLNKVFVYNQCHLDSNKVGSGPNAKFTSTLCRTATEVDKALFVIVIWTYIFSSDYNDNWYRWVIAYDILYWICHLLSICCCEAFRYLTILSTLIFLLSVLDLCNCFALLWQNTEI